MNNKITDTIREFNKERNWEQFHTPKNLAISVSLEASELLECFQWKDESANVTADEKTRVTDEIADILIYLITLSDRLDIDLESAIIEKVKKNGEKYPIEKAKGNAEKYRSV